MSSPVPPPEPAIQTAARLLAEGEPARAAAQLAALVADAPTYAAAHVLRATALEAAGRIDDALVSWGRAATLVPRSPLVHRERERLLATHIAGEFPPDLAPAVPASADPPEGPGADATAEGAAETTEQAPDTAAPPEASPSTREDPADESAEAAGELQRVVEAGHPAVETPNLEDDLDALFPDEDADALHEDETVDGPLLGFGSPQVDPPDPAVGPAPPRLDLSDLLFDPSEAGSEPGAEGRAAPMVSSPSVPDPAPPLPPADEEWGADETGLASVLPPEGDPSLAPPSGPPACADAGWDVLSEADVPTPPPGVYAEPDIVAPEGAAPPDSGEDPFADIDDVVDEFGALDPFGAPEAPPGDLSVADELDALIAQLEDAPRIRPDPTYSGPEVSLDHGDVDDMASETLAKIYAAQHQYVEAAIVYEKLAARQPEQADVLLERAAELRQRGG